MISHEARKKSGETSVNEMKIEVSSGTKNNTESPKKNICLITYNDKNHTFERKREEQQVKIFIGGLNFGTIAAESTMYTRLSNHFVSVPKKKEKKLRVNLCIDGFIFGIFQL